MSEIGRITPCWSIHFERTSKHSAARLWRAITDPKEVTHWMALPARVDLRVGGEYHVDFSPIDGQLDGVIVRLETERRLAMVWGLSVLEWTITPEADACRYTFLHHGQPPGLVDDEAGIAAGWHAWLDDLDTHTDGGTPDDGKARVAALMPAYSPPIAELIGP